MFKKITFIMAGASLLMATSALMAQEKSEEKARDPFLPYIFGGNKAVTTTQEVEKKVPSARHGDAKVLENNPLESFRVVGTFTTKDRPVVVVRAKNQRDYFVELGQGLGSEGGIVEVISTEGITVNVKGETFDIPVSNKIEVKNEKASS